MRPYEIVEHTADIGIRAFGRSREELFVHLAEGMFSLIVPPDEVRPVESIRVAVQADGWENLLRAWLKELLYRFDAGHFLAKEFKINRLEQIRLEAIVRGEKLDLSKHSVDKEVKAVTYCDFQLEQSPEGLWTSQVIFDI